MKILKKEMLRLSVYIIYRKNYVYIFILEPVSRSTANGAIQWEPAMTHLENLGFVFFTMVRFAFAHLLIFSWHKSRTEGCCSKEYHLLNVFLKFFFCFHFFFWNIHYLCWKGFISRTLELNFANGMILLQQKLKIEAKFSQPPWHGNAKKNSLSCTLPTD